VHVKVKVAVLDALIRIDAVTITSFCISAQQLK
jgi:hypothetical protein